MNAEIPAPGSPFGAAPGNSAWRGGGAHLPTPLRVLNYAHLALKRLAETAAGGGSGAQPGEE